METNLFLESHNEGGLNITSPIHRNEATPYRILIPGNRSPVSRWDFEARALSVSPFCQNRPSRSRINIHHAGPRERCFWQANMNRSNLSQKKTWKPEQADRMRLGLRRKDVTAFNRGESETDMSVSAFYVSWNCNVQCRIKASQSPNNVIVCRIVTDTVALNHFQIYQLVVDNYSPTQFCKIQI